MKNNSELPLPVKLLKEYSTKYPRCFEYTAKMNSDKGIALPNWSDLCYIPISATLAIANKYPNVDLGIFPSELAALASWRNWKEIYSFDTEMIDVLFQQAEDIEIPIDIIYQLPFPCIYISLNYDEIDGFFVWFEHDDRSDFLELRLMVYFGGANNTPTPFIVYLKQGNTISDGIAQAVGKSIENYNKSSDKEIPDDFANEAVDSIFKTVSQLLQLVLYICADNAEISDKPTGTAADNINANLKMIANLNKSKIHKVGEHTGEIIREMYISQSNAKKDYNNVNAETGKTVRPHIRKGHWHHYWIGKRNNRKTILRWIAPVLVNVDDDSVDTDIIIRKIKPPAE